MPFVAVPDVVYVFPLQIEAEAGPASAVGELSLSTILTVPIPVAIYALVGLESDILTNSSPSTKRSSKIGKVKVLAVSPGAKVNVPLIAE